MVLSFLMCTTASITSVSELVTCGKQLTAHIHLEREQEAESRWLRSKGGGKPSTGAFSSGRSKWPVWRFWSLLHSCGMLKVQRVGAQNAPSPSVKTCTTAGSRMMHGRCVQTPQTYRGKMQPASLHSLKAANMAAVARTTYPAGRGTEAQREGKMERQRR